MPRYSNYNVSAGMNTRLPSNSLPNNQAQNIINLNLENSSGDRGMAKARLEDITLYTHGDTVNSVAVWYDGDNQKIISAVDGALYINGVFSRAVNSTKFTFAEHNSALYCFGDADDPFKLTNGGSFNMGAPVPSGSVSVAEIGVGLMSADTAQSSRYNVKVTFVTRHYNSNGGYYDSESGPGDAGYNSVAIGASSTGASLAITSIPVNNDANYSVIARRLYIQGGKTPYFSKYVRVWPRYYDVDNNQWTWQPQLLGNDVVSCTIAVASNEANVSEFGVDRLDELITTRALPPKVAFGLVHFDHFVLAGEKANKDRWYFSKVSDENINPVDFIKDRDDIQGMIRFNNVVYTPLKDGLYVKSGSTENNFYNQDTEVADGCIAPYTLGSSPFGVGYLSYRGVVLYNGTAEPTIVSQDVGPDFQTLPSAYYDNACGIYFDGKYYISVTESGYTQNNITWVYDSIAKGWSKINKGYNCFAKDNKTYSLYAGYGNTVVKIAGSTTYKPWEYRWGDTEIDPDRRGYPKSIEIEIDTKGQDVVLTPYYDRVAQTSMTINCTGRQKLFRMLPAGLCNQVSIGLAQGSSNYQSILYNFTVEVEA